MHELSAASQKQDSQMEDINAEQFYFYKQHWHQNKKLWQLQRKLEI